MATVSEEIRRCDSAIANNIAALSGDRGLMSVNILNNTRNLINQIALLISTSDTNADSKYADIDAAMRLMKTRSDLSFLRTFYNQTQGAVSHYTLDEEGAERLMLKYYEVLIKIRDYLHDNYDIGILKSLGDFPLDTDSSQQNYYESIANKIENLADNAGSIKDNCYIHRVKPFFVKNKVYYEIVFSPAIDRDNKFNRRIAFSSDRVFGNYATDLWLAKSQIEVDGIKVPIEIVESWKTNIRPCELNNLGRIINFDVKADRGQKDYLPIMDFISRYQMSLVEIIDLDDRLFASFVRRVKVPDRKSTVVDLIQSVRKFCRSQSVGSNTVRYLLLNMRNATIKRQYPYYAEECLSNVFLSKKVYPFEKMPLCTSLKEHNPRLQDVLLAIPLDGREHELIARKILANTEQRGMLYTPKDDLPQSSNIDTLVHRYNGRLYYGHANRIIEKHDDYYFIRGYENDVKEIVKTLKSLCNTGVSDYEADVKSWLSKKDRGIDDDAKKHILSKLLATSRVAVIYGAAGTGKTRMIEHISSYFNAEDKLYLANTKTAVSNLSTRLEGAGRFMTVAKSLQASGLECSVLFIDECSTISNKDMVNILKWIKFDYLVLVGDVYQIESIRFGNWFNIIRKFLPKQSVFELEVPFRTKDDNLIQFWGAIRARSGTTEEIMARQGYARRLDSTIFSELSDEEIILCLNYDGLYGVNNINKLLQSKNEGKSVNWNGSVYKVGDPIVFNESDAYGQVLFNNLKGKIENIEAISAASVDFTLDIIGADISDQDAASAGLELVDTNRVKIRVEKRHNNDNDDSSDDAMTIVPFQVAYAVTIHKAQGLEYESVKIVVTRDSEEQVTQNIFYTAITRATKNLNIYWSPEVQHAVLSSFTEEKDHDLGIFLSRNHGLLK